MERINTIRVIPHSTIKPKKSDEEKLKKTRIPEDK
jgi:hypothetical protein